MSLEFLSAVLPTQGKYCAFTLRNGKPHKTVFVDTLDNLLQTNLKFSDQGLNAFNALASFDDEGSREADHALYMRSFFMDLDCGDGKSFTTKKLAREQLASFLQASGLGTLGAPWLVDSGGGIHVYWPLQEDVAIDEWRPVAQGLKQAAKKAGFAIDMSVTADAARVLRTPGTMNSKYDPPKSVTLREQGDVFDAQAIAEIVGRYAPVAAPKPASTALTIPGKRPTLAEMSPAAKAMMGNNVTYFKNIVVKTVAGEGCNQVAHYMNNAQQDGMEPLWRGILSLTKYCDDADKAALKISALHPYDYDRMQTKLAAIKGPYSCLALESENPGGCDGCQHRGRITNPLILGREVQTIAEAAPVMYAPQEDEYDDSPAPMQEMKPTPPRGFEYGRNGGVYYVKPATKDEDQQRIMLTGFDFYMSRMFRDGQDHVAEFVVVKGGERITFGIPTSVVGDGRASIKELSKNNVFAEGGAACDVYLAAYVRACMNEASREGKYVPVPPRLGWQENGDFVISDHVYSARGRRHDYQYKSNRLSNVIEITQPRGDFGKWKEVMEMMRRKAIADPMVWGHCATAMTGFASPLMKFAPKGAAAVVVHICGKATGAGKSLSSILANSVWGNPTGMRVGNKTSETTMMQRAGMLGSIHLNVDEVTEKNRKSGGEWLPAFLYDFSHGEHKIKGSATGNAEIQQDSKWNSMGLISSNDPALEAMMGARDHTSYGEARRFLEWQLPRDWKISWTDEEREILRQIDDNYGVAGRYWIEWLMDNQDLAQDVYERILARWRKVSGADDNERFWTSGIAAELTATVLCSSGVDKKTGRRFAGIIDFPYSKIEEFWLGIVQYMRSVINANSTSALDMLNSYTREYIGNFVKIDGSMQATFSHLLSGNTAKNAVRGRIEYDVNPGYVDYYIEVKLMKIHCAHVGYSYLEFVKELEGHPKISVIEMRKDLLAGTKSPAMRVNCLRITRAVGDVDPDEV